MHTTIEKIEFNRANWRVSLVCHNDSDFDKKRAWCNVNCQDWWCCLGPEKWFFGSKEEATQFYMTWA